MEIKTDKIKLIDTDSIIPNPRNANNHNDRQIELLAKIIKHNGFRQPLIISNRSKFLITGHGRLLAAKKLGMTHLPVMFQDFESEAQEFQAMIADNKIAELAEHDDLKMIEGIKELDIKDFELLGLDDFNLENLDEQKEKEKSIEDKSKFLLLLELKDETELRMFFDEMQSREIACTIME